MAYNRIRVQCYMLHGICQLLDENMRIGIDARFYGTSSKGLGRYTQKLIENLEKIDSDNEYVVFLRKDNFAEYVPRNPNFHKELADYRWYSFAEQLLFPLKIRGAKVDLMHFPHFNVPLLNFIPFVVTIHDLILLHFPTKRASTHSALWYRFKYAAYRLVIAAAVVRAKRIITVSEFTRRDLLAHYRNLAAQKIALTYEACFERAGSATSEPEKILSKYGIMKPYVLYVGNAYPHKNLEKLAESFSLLKKDFPDLSLVLVGKEDYFYARLKKEIAQEGTKKVVFAGYVPDKDLKVLYAQAEVYAFASLYEGFGLPPLEAMANGAPVVSSNHECMQEILGDAAFFADARNPHAFGAALKNVLKNKRLQQDLREKGFKQCAKYDWAVLAKETMEVYRRALG